MTDIVWFTLVAFSCRRWFYYK